MMQDARALLRTLRTFFTVQSNGGVATHPLLVDLPNPRGRSYAPRFCIKMTAKDARTAAIKNHFAQK